MLRRNWMYSRTCALHSAVVRYVLQALRYVLQDLEGTQPGDFSGGCWLVFGVPDVSRATHFAIMGEMVATLVGLAAVRAASVP